MNKLKDTFQLLRVRQYVKNFFIFAPLFFGFKLTDTSVYLPVLISFVAFSFTASSVYIFNDIKDLEYDKKHPTKKFRPLPAGKISQQDAAWIAVILAIMGVLLGGIISLNIVWLLLIYLGINLLYSSKLKQIAIVDLFVIALGFLIRLLIGGQAAAVDLHPWIIVMTFLIALFFAIAKRRDDVLMYNETGTFMRKVIKEYNLPFLDAMLICMSTVLIVAYVIYTLSEDVTARLGSDKLYLTTFWVVMGIFKYLQLVFVKKKSGSPTEVILKERSLQLIFLSWLISFGALMYI